MSASTKIARRYAKAVMSLCDERGDGEVVRTALDALAAVLVQVPQALQFLSNPTMPFEERRGLLVQLLDATAVQNTARNLVLLLLDKGRIAEILRVRSEFATLLDLRTGRVEAEVSGLRAVPEIDGVAFELDPCAPMRGAPCPSTITVANAGADLAVENLADTEELLRWILAL